MSTLPNSFYEGVSEAVQVPVDYLKPSSFKSSNEQVLYFNNKLKGLQEVFKDEVKGTINYFIKKYGGWNKYPRKTKKRLKKAKIWYWKDIDIAKLEIKVK